MRFLFRLGISLQHSKLQGMAATMSQRANSCSDIYGFFNECSGAPCKDCACNRHQECGSTRNHTQAGVLSVQAADAVVGCQQQRARQVPHHARRNHKLPLLG
jgi:hypothetical protein